MHLLPFLQKSLFVLLIVVPAVARANCPPIPNVKQLDIATLPVEVLSVKRVPAEKISPKASFLKKQLNFGLVHTSPQNYVSVTGRTISLPTGETCLYPMLKLITGYAPMTIFIASELPERGCAYNAVLTHETQHVEIYRQHLPKMVQQVEQGLKPVFSQGFITTDPKRMLKKIEADTSKYAQGVLSAEWAAVKKAQAVYDDHDIPTTLNGPCAAEFVEARRRS